MRLFWHNGGLTIRPDSDEELARLIALEESIRNGRAAAPDRSCSLLGQEPLNRTIVEARLSPRGLTSEAEKPT